mgnify:CR=1 FL=1
MEYKVRGVIKSISPIESVGAGKKLSFRIDTGEKFNNLIEFELYKGAEYLSHVEKFGEYNKVGDNVEVEFNLRTYNWKPEAENKIFTSLSCWKVEKVSGAAPLPLQDEVDGGGDLPF